MRLHGYTEEPVTYVHQHDTVAFNQQQTVARCLNFTQQAWQS